MPSDWPTITIDDLKAPSPNAIAMGPFGSRIRRDNFVANGVPVIRGNNLNAERFGDCDFVYLTEEKADELRSANVKQHDIVVTHRGTLGQIGIIPQKSRFRRYVVSQSQMKLTIDPEKADPFFVFYYLRSPYGQHQLLANTSQTGVPAIARPTRALKSVSIPFPPLPEQRAIAHILGTLDDKIELNRRMNQTLEEIARAIFQSWFIDFDPVRAKATGRQPEGMDAETAALFPDAFVDSELGEIPAGWESMPIGSICSLEIGGDWGQDQAFDGGIEVACLRGVDLERLRQDGHASAPLRWIKPASVEKRALDERDVLVAGSGAGPTGRPLWIVKEIITAFDQPVIYSNFCKRFRSATSSHAAYLDRVLHEMRMSGEIWEYVSGTSVPNLNARGLFSSKYINVPPTSVLQRFENHLRPMVRRLYSQENQTISSLRDTLLPKLLSGELRVPDAERLVEHYR
jgi:type I restriction enzyme S subunit